MILERFRFLVAVSFLGALVFLASCTNETEDGLASDCSNSTLTLEVSSTTEAGCNVSGSITVVGSGGEGTIEYSIDGTTFSASSTFSDLSAGSYQITAMDANGCQVSIAATVEAAAGSVSLEVASTNTGCGEENGTVTATGSGADGSFEYSIDGSNFTANNIFTDLASGEYTVTVRSGDCEATRTVQITSDVTLSGNIMPIISANCGITGCHGNAVSPRLNSTQDIIAAAARIQARTSARTMPPASRSPLSDQQIQDILCWVEDGATNN